MLSGSKETGSGNGGQTTNSNAGIELPMRPLRGSGNSDSSACIRVKADRPSYVPLGAT